MRLEAILEAAAADHPDRQALVCGDAGLTFAAVDASANRLAQGLRRDGIAPGDRVMVCLDNVPECVVGIFGVLKAGAVLVLVNAGTKGGKLARLLADSGARGLLVGARKAAETAAVLAATPDLRTIVVVEEAGATLPPAVAAHSWRQWQQTVPATPLPRATAAADLACLLYTSGSTGMPKGVMHTHRSLGSATRSIAQYLELGAGDAVLSVLPLSFGYGLSQLLTTWLRAGRLVLERSFAFPQLTLQRMATERITGFAMVPTIAANLLRYDLTKFDLSALRFVTIAGAGIAPAVLAELRQRLPHVRIYPMYGQTECIRATFLPPDEVDRRPTSVGRGMPDTEIWIVDGNGARLPPGSSGELVVKGPQLMQGYWNMPEATREKLRPGSQPGEQVLYTGDLFRLDADGWFHFVARMDDVIKTRGEKVSPREVEDVLHALEGVQTAAVVAAPDAILGEVVIACVVRKPGCVLAAKDVLAFCARHLEDFAVPKRVEFLEAMPTTANAKIDKQALREILEIP